MFISTFLIRWCRFCKKQKNEFFWHMGTLLILCFIAAIAINYTNILAVHGGGRFLWGGTYCFLYYIGILLEEKACFKIRSRGIRLVGIVVLFVMWLLWWDGMCRGVLPFDGWLSSLWGAGFNPPSVHFMVFALITLFLCYAFFSLLDEMSEIYLIRWFVNGLSWIGRNTLYIFMYHLLAGSIETYIFFRLNIGLARIIPRICYFMGMLVIPVCAKEIFVSTMEKVKAAIYEQL